MAAAKATTKTDTDEATSDTGTGGGGGIAAITSKALSARELEWAVNSPTLLEEHAALNGPIIRTRFPPEPNGYLHVGHAKSMNMNFSLAFEKLGVPPEHRRTIFRYDDTNPEAESAEYIESLRKDLDWLGWTPERTTYSSDNFQQLYDFAVQLIQKGLAYVCDMTKDEMEAQRELAMKRANLRNNGKDPDDDVEGAPIASSDILPGRNRNNSIEYNLQMFEKMKMGLFDEGSYTLRLKMDFDSSNPNMYDLVAYRIKYIPHPHAGSGWCVYPNYDFTHGICDSLEAIDYSICTLEFETRREPYYWILWALDLYRPQVYEMARLNLQYTVLSKRRLLKLVTNKYVRGWDDPRMPTISGMRRRGYTKDIINTFCNDVGASRASNVVEMSKLEQTARLELSTTSRRAMAALDPILVTISNLHDDKETLTFEVQNSPTDASLGSHVVTLTKQIYIDASDFRLQDSKTYYGLAPQKAVGLKYHGGNLFCDEVISDDHGKVVELKCHVDTSPDRIKPKSFITWVPSDGIPCEVRVYNHLFTVAEPTDQWEEELNADSEVVYPRAIVDPSVREVVDAKHVDKWKSNVALQFERIGYFVVDQDTTYDSETNTGNLVFNRTVSLKEEVFKKKLTPEEEAAIEQRRVQAKKALEDKERRMQIDPINLFREADEYKGKYSKYNEKTGVPTHLADGTELPKSAMKKLDKEKQKHIKARAKWQKKK